MLIGVLLAGAAAATPETFGPLPPGAVTQVDLGNDSGCAVDAAGALACWSRAQPSFPLGTPPAGTFRRVEVGTSFACGQRSDGTLACFGLPGSRTLRPRRRRRVLSGRGPVCPPPRRERGLFPPRRTERHPGRRAQGVVDLRRRSLLRPHPPARRSAWCPDPFLDERSRVPAPSGPFDLLVAGYEHTCALRPDGSATCWGRDTEGETVAPDGRFTHLALGEKRSCGLQPDGAVTCWGGAPGGPWPGPFLDVFVTTNESLQDAAWVCGLRPNHTLACWRYEAS